MLSCAPSVMVVPVRHNSMTRNLNTLLAHMLARLERVDGMTTSDVLNTVNLVFLGRTFLKCVLDCVDGASVILHLDAGNHLTGVATSWSL